MGGPGRVQENTIGCEVKLIEGFYYSDCWHMISKCIVYCLNYLIQLSVIGTKVWIIKYNNLHKCVKLLMDVCSWKENCVHIMWRKEVDVNKYLACHGPCIDQTLQLIIQRSSHTVHAATFPAETEG